MLLLCSALLLTRPGGEAAEKTAVSGASRGLLQSANDGVVTKEMIYQVRGQRRAAFGAFWG